jgi:hypothetical protein
MADNTRLNVGSAGDTIRTIEKGTFKTQVVTLDLGGSGAESLTSGTVPVSGTVGLDSASLAALETISVANFPATQAVSGNVGVTGSVEIMNDTGNPIPSNLSNGTTAASIEAFGSLAVNTGFQTLFYESWSTSPINTTEKWTVTGTAPTIASGNMTMSATLNSYNAIQSKDVIIPNAGFSHVRNGILLEVGTVTGCGRFWGYGTPASVPSATSLCQDGAGFELDSATGALYAVTYAAGVRTIVATLTKPTDGAYHRYGMSFRVTQIYWFIDNQTISVATQSFPNLQIVELPSLIVRRNDAAFVGTPVFTNIAHLSADTAKQATVLSDPVIGTRQARVKAPSTLPAATDSALVVTVRDAVRITNDTRTYVSYSAGGVAAALTTVEALITLTKSGAVGAATTTGTSFVIPAGKRFRITSVTFATRGNAVATSQNTTFSIRANTAGAITTTSPAFLSGRSATPATALTYDRLSLTFGADGVEVAGDGTLQFGVSAVSVYTTNGPTWDVLITGYEY